jgi:hypothetical protein
LGKGQDAQVRVGKGADGLKGNLKIASLYQGINDALQCRLASVWVANLSDDLQGTNALSELSVL